MLSTSVGGMQVAMDRLDMAAARIATAAAPGTDLVQDVPELVVATAAFSANAAALRTQGETTGFLLDVLAR